jgi:hypothetical protein
VIDNQHWKIAQKNLNGIYLMNLDVYSGKVNVQKHFQFGQPEVCWTVGVGNSHRLPDFAVLETPQLAV